MHIVATLDSVKYLAVAFSQTIHYVDDIDPGILEERAIIRMTSSGGGLVVVAVVDFLSERIHPCRSQGSLCVGILPSG